jgi:hypothetical protein
MNIKTLNTLAIRIDGGTQARAEINLEVVAEYAAALTDGVVFPPVEVTFDGAEYWLEDGFHRVHAHVQAARASIAAIVRTGTTRDAILRSLSANLSHGLRRSNADKRKAINTLLADAEWGQWSNRDIAKTCGVSHSLVNDLRTPKVEVLPPQAPSIPESAPSVPKVEVLPPAARAKRAEPASDPAGEEADAQANAAFGEDDTVAMLEASEAECVQLRALVAAAEEDDQKSATIKWKRIADVAQRRQNELMDTVNQRERELKRLMAVVRGVCEAVGTEDQTKVLSMVRALVKANSTAAA